MAVSCHEFLRRARGKLAITVAISPLEICIIHVGRLLVVRPTSQKIVDRCADCTNEPQAARRHDAVDEKQSHYWLTLQGELLLLSALSHEERRGGRSGVRLFPT
jgi:hypothetical protein